MSLATTINRAQVRAHKAARERNHQMSLFIPSEDGRQAGSACLRCGDVMVMDGTGDTRGAPLVAFCAGESPDAEDAGEAAASAVVEVG